MEREPFKTSPAASPAGQPKPAKKTFVGVRALFDTAGNITPLCVLWADGRRFAVDKVLDVRPCASLKCGGFGVRYTCRIGMRETYLFLEENRWYVEKRI